MKINPAPRSKFLISLLPLIILLLASPALGAEGQNVLSDGSFWAKGSQASVGSLNLKLLPPPNLNMVRVDGRDKLVDDYIKSIEPKFKINILAIYADLHEWNEFTTAIKNKNPSPTPPLAMVCVPQKMAEKSFDSNAFRKEKSRYSRWFSLAANNGAMIKLLTKRGNNKLSEKIGLNIDFRFKTGPNTAKFSDRSNSVSFGAQVSLKLFGELSEMFLTASAMHFHDKMIFLAYGDKFGPDKHLKSVQEQTLDWLKTMVIINNQ
ncbi:MAG: hypothetical protein ACRCTY_01930 [Candidatus Adiutrix sp.]